MITTFVGAALIALQMLLGAAPTTNCQTQPTNIVVTDQSIVN